MANKNPNFLALDVGQQRIGVAVASGVARLPAPHGVIINNQNALVSLTELVQAEQIGTVVIGLPRGLKGQETAQTGLTRKFIDLVKQIQGVEVYVQDEALTSKKAEQELSKRKIEYNKGDVDALAATYILEDFLHEHPVDLQ